MAEAKQDEKDQDERERTPAERAQARYDRGERRALKAEVELAERPNDDRHEVREGMVFESLRTDEDEIGGGRRRVKVLDPSHEGKVLVENLSSRRHSHISADRLVPEHGWDRYV